MELHNADMFQFWLFAVHFGSDKALYYHQYSLQFISTKQNDIYSIYIY